MSIGLAPWEAATSDLAARAGGGRPSAPVLSRVTARDRPAGSWIGQWVATAAAEVGAVVPVRLAQGAPRRSESPA